MDWINRMFASKYYIYMCKVTAAKVAIIILENLMQFLLQLAALQWGFWWRLLLAAPATITGLAAVPPCELPLPFPFSAGPAFAPPFMPAPVDRWLLLCRMPLLPL